MNKLTLNIIGKVLMGLLMTCIIAGMAVMMALVCLPWIQYVAFVGGMLLLAALAITIMMMD